MIDMDRRLRPVRRWTFAVIAVALALAAPWVGWWTLGALVVAGALFWLAEPRIEGAEHPEYWMLAAWAGAEAIIAGSVVLTGDAALSMLCLLAIPVVTLSARFTRRGIWVGVTLAGGLMIAVALGTNASAVWNFPPHLIAPLALVVTGAMLSTALRDSDAEHRGKAVIDPLTGLLNGRSLRERVVELEQVSGVSGEPVGVISADLDEFKAVNDTHGHAAGDAALMEVGYAIRKAVGRAFALAYRTGGDEFVILLPGADLHDARMIATLVRAGVASLDLDFPVSVSCGFSASVEGERFVFENVFQKADDALYEAKEGGGLVGKAIFATEVFGGSEAERMKGPDALAKPEASGPFRASE
jgi:diguanylate cyclase (GGDEF)-like protein